MPCAAAAQRRHQWVAADVSSETAEDLAKAQDDGLQRRPDQHDRRHERECIVA
jgi:hypothetical protein